MFMLIFIGGEAYHYLPGGSRADVRVCCRLGATKRQQTLARDRQRLLLLRKTFESVFGKRFAEQISLIGKTA